MRQARTETYVPYRPDGNSRGYAYQARPPSAGSFSYSPASGSSGLSASSPEQIRAARRLEVQAVSSRALQLRQPGTRSFASAASTIDVRADGFVDNRRPNGHHRPDYAQAVQTLDCTRLREGSNPISMRFRRWRNEYGPKPSDPTAGVDYLNYSQPKDRSGLDLPCNALHPDIVTAPRTRFKNDRAYMITMHVLLHLASLTAHGQIGHVAAIEELITHEHTLGKRKQETATGPSTAMPEATPDTEGNPVLPPPRARPLHRPEARQPRTSGFVPGSVSGHRRHLRTRP